MVYLLEELKEKKELKWRDVDYKDTAKPEVRLHNHICCESN